MPTPLTLPVSFGSHQPPLGAPLRRNGSLAASVRALWLCNEGAGATLTDSVARQRTAAFSGPKWVGGPRGKALQYNGTSDFLALGTATRYFVAAPCWYWLRLRLDALPSGTGRIVADYDSSGGQSAMEFRASPTGVVQFGFYNVAAFFSLGLTAAVGDWHDYVGTLDASNVPNIYRDGIQLGAGTGTTRPSISGGVLTLGRAGAYNGVYVACTIGSFAIGAGTITVPQVRQLLIAPYSLF